MTILLLVNGALSGGGEYKIRRKLIDPNLVEVILVLLQNMFYTADINLYSFFINKVE
jgi:type I restriction enzyme M protein